MSIEDKKKEALMLIKELIETTETEDRRDEIILKLQVIVPDPSITDYIYYSKIKMSAEEIVEKAFSYKPILL